MKEEQSNVLRVSLLQVSHPSRDQLRRRLAPTVSQQEREFGEGQRKRCLGGTNFHSRGIGLCSPRGLDPRDLCVILLDKAQARVDGVRVFASFRYVALGRRRGSG